MKLNELKIKLVKRDGNFLKNCFNKGIQKLIWIAFLLFPVISPAQQSHLRLAINKYECISNDTCGVNQYCDIDSHVCKNLPICEVCEVCQVCETCETCEVCPEILSCAEGWHKLDDNCVECLFDQDCSGEKPYCNTKRYECVACVNNNDCSDKAYPICENDICTCPDNSVWDVEKQNCVIRLESSTLNSSNTSPVYMAVVQKFGPYKHNWSIKFKGRADDGLWLKVNSSNMPANGVLKQGYRSAVDGTETHLNGQTVILKAGDWGGILLYSEANGRVYWYDPGEIWLELAD